ncbi:MAG: glycosyltransferase [Actinomycetota bacterium]
MNDDVMAERLTQAVANARLLARELAARDTRNEWSQSVTIEAEFIAAVAAPSTVAPTPGVDPRTTLERTAVVCWDMAHNPAGRAMVLADLHLRTSRVDLVGPLWSRFGTGVWGPIEEGGYSTVTFRCERLADFLPKAYALAAHRRYDLVHVCKPRLPGLILGSMIARANDCPIIIDIDDEEQAFFASAGDVDLSDYSLDELHEPTELYGTHQGVALASRAPTKSVSNVELGRVYGGAMLRHARDERVFDPSVVSREAGRFRLGADDQDFVVLFVGTPRPHKGLGAVVEALRLLNDPRVVLHVVGVANRPRFDEEVPSDGVRIVTHLPTDMAVLPELLAAGDAIALMQNLDDPISDFQIPSKISDALSMDVPLIVTNAPPLRDLQDHGLLRADDPAELAAHLRDLVDGNDVNEGRRRAAFLGEFSIGVNAARASLAVDDAVVRKADAHDAVVEPVLDLARRAYANERRRERPDLFDEPDPGGDGVDIVFFWKQNDSGIYGRRSDMLAKHFAADPRVRRVLHIDAPISTEDAFRDARHVADSSADHTPLLRRGLLDRRLELVEGGAVHHRTFLHTVDEDAFDPITGEPMGMLEDFPAFVRAEMNRLSMSPERSIAWVCPVVADFLAVHDELGFRTVVSDVIDDQRSMTTNADYAARLDTYYRELLAASDKVFTNCEPNVAAFSSYGGDMTVVQNGAEVEAYDPVRRDPLDERPVVAYVGNMRDRVDWLLLDELASLRQDCRFVFAGSAHGRSDVHHLAQQHENVELLGVVPYAQLPELLAGVDVGLVPHLTGPMTESMNPLKVYNYYAAGVPIVTTPIPNMDELLNEVSVATDAAGFGAAIDTAVERRRAGKVAPDAALLDTISWRTRATDILDALAAAGLL